jgi:hypothetical protein
MAAYHPPKIASSEITPKQTYFGRRGFLAAAAGAGASMAFGNSAMAEALTATKSDYTVNEKLTPIKDVTTYNNFYEFGMEKGRSRVARWKLQTEALDDQNRQHGRQAADIRSRSADQDVPAGGAGLPDALRRGLVDGHSVGWVRVVEAAGCSRAAWKRQVCGL